MRSDITKSRIVTARHLHVFNIKEISNVKLVGVFMILCHVTFYESGSNKVKSVEDLRFLKP